MNDIKYEYPLNEMESLQGIINELNEYARLQSEYGNIGEVKSIYERLCEIGKASLDDMKNLSPEGSLKACEPDDYESIVALSRCGNQSRVPDNLKERMMGAIMGRFAGCMLGIPFEGHSHESLKKYATEYGMEFPPKDYWVNAVNPDGIQYGIDKRINYTKGNIHGCAVDDDITYTILGYLIIKKYGFDFTTEDVGEIWKEILPYACTAEAVTLENLKKGIDAYHAAEINNPYIQWIGADIRADGFAYAAAGDPHLAAKLAYRDAYLSHRRNGIYGEMYFAAAEAAAFLVKDPMTALTSALNEIPENCSLHKDIEWALNTRTSIHTYIDAVNAVENRFSNMSRVHTNNNACLTVFGIHLGNGDFTNTISNTVAMGYDNDCTGATAGSIVGAALGINNIPHYWYDCFEDEVRTYLKGYPKLKISEMADDLCQIVQHRQKL